MERVFAFAAIVSLCAGCGAAGSGNGAAGAEPTPAAAPDAGEAAAAEPAPAAPIVGGWENGSCGERHYRRLVRFFEDGRFTGLDEVAPCPPKAQCVWSGIIHWKGSWSFDGKRVSLEIEPIEGEKTPEAQPEEFEVVSADPFSIGERSGDVVCPYRRAD